LSQQRTKTNIFEQQLLTTDCSLLYTLANNFVPVKPVKEGSLACHAERQRSIRGSHLSIKQDQMLSGGEA
jgi:hypothetical protein